MSQLEKFEALLRQAAVLGAEVRVVPMINATYGDVEFYAHIDGHDSETVDISITNGPGLAWLPLERAASGLRGDGAKDISEKSDNFTRQPLNEISG